ncbi:MAG: hypothetical protein LVT47_15465 [Cyanobacteria bacterium LVE1205-1]|jgi:hypothetical protein
MLPIKSPNAEGMNYAPVFTSLLSSINEVAKGFLVRRLQPEMPITVDDQKVWFAPCSRRWEHGRITLPEALETPFQKISEADIKSWVTHCC